MKPKSSPPTSPPEEAVIPENIKKGDSTVEIEEDLKRQIEVLNKMISRLKQK